MKAGRVKWHRPKDELPPVHPEIGYSVRVLVWNRVDGTDAARLMKQKHDGALVWFFGNRTYAGPQYADLWAYMPEPPEEER